MLSTGRQESEVYNKLRYGSQIILMRHAESKTNKIKADMRSGCFSEEDLKRVRTDIENIDPSITDLGILQCETTAEITNNLNVEIVLVSPMTRTILTAYNVFKNHPNFRNMKFILVPCLKELLSSISSIPMNILKTIRLFKKLFPNWDITLLNDYLDLHHYYLEDIDDDFAKIILEENVVDPEDPSVSNSTELVVDIIRSGHPKKPESYKSGLKRTRKVKEFIQNLLHSKALSDDSKIFVVTHGILGRIWTGEWDRPLDEYDEIPMPSKCKRFDNCELYSDNINFPRKEQ